MQKILDESRNFLGLEKEFSTLERSRISILPIPYRYKTTDIGDPQKAPASILAASHQINRFDEETKRDLAKERGITTFAPLSFTRKDHEASQQLIFDTILKLVQQEKFVVALGGDHTIATASIAAHAKFYFDLSVLHFGASAHLRSHLNGDKNCSVSAMARVCEYLDPHRLVQAGIRSLSKDEAEYQKKFGIRTFFMHDIRGGVHTKVLKYWDDFIVDCLAENVYISFDVNAFDPSVVPTALSPVPGGLLWYETLQCIKKISRKRRIIGFDISGLSPTPAHPFADVTIAKFIFKTLTYSL